MYALMSPSLRGCGLINVMYLFAALFVGALGYIAVWVLPIRRINPYFGASLTGRIYMIQGRAFEGSFYENKRRILQTLDELPSNKQFSIITHDVLRKYLQRQAKQGRVTIISCRKCHLQRIHLTPLERAMGKRDNFSSWVTAYKIRFVKLS